MKFKKLMVIALSLCLAFSVAPLSAQAAMKGKGPSHNREMQHDRQNEARVANPATTTAVTGSAITLKLDQTTANVTVGQKTVVKASVSVAKASTKAKKNKKYKSVKWTSSDTTVASVSKGSIIGLKPGTATITATVQGSTNVIATCTVTVTASTTPKEDYLALLKAKKFTTDQIALVEANNASYTDAQWETLLESAMVMTRAEWGTLKETLSTTTDTSTTDNTDTADTDTAD